MPVMSPSNSSISSLEATSYPTTALVSSLISSGAISRASSKSAKYPAIAARKLSGERLPAMSTINRTRPGIGARFGPFDVAANAQKLTAVAVRTGAAVGIGAGPGGGVAGPAVGIAVVGELFPAVARAVSSVPPPQDAATNTTATRAHLQELNRPHLRASCGEGRSRNDRPFKGFLQLLRLLPGPPERPGTTSAGLLRGHQTPHRCRSWPRTRHPKPVAGRIRVGSAKRFIVVRDVCVIEWQYRQHERTWSRPILCRRRVWVRTNQTSRRIT